jgi:hypothetical protein
MSFLDNIQQLFQQGQSITSINDAGNMAEEGASLSAGAFRVAGTAAVQGGQYSAAVYRNAGLAATAATAYNIELSKLEQARKLDALSVNLGQITSTNRSMQGASGFSFNSGSYLAVVRDGLARMEKSVQNMSTTYEQQRTQLTYQGQLTNMNYENQARNAEYQGQVAKVNYENQALQADYQGKVAQYQAQAQNGKNLTSMFQNITSLR